jgi:hypothetical protein
MSDSLSDDDDAEYSQPFAVRACKKISLKICFCRNVG